MIPELGQFCLILSLLVAAAQAWAGWGAAKTGDAGLGGVATRAARLQFALVLAAFLALMACFVTSDFSVKTVVDNSHTMKPMLYKIAGVWGNHEGSMLLWVLVLSLYGAIMSMTGAKPLVLAVQGAQGVGFLGFALFASNPFTRLTSPPIDGHDLNPLLQDPALAMHPPMLYLGYVGFSAVFSYAVALLLRPGIERASPHPNPLPGGEGILVREWARAVRPWVLGAWSALSAGIALGSWWAYYELGWGGFWFWDPVENASLMPWLLGTALLHSVIATEKRGAFPRWTLLLAILAYSLSLLGTFLVRSGVLTSVHAFAVDPLRGLFVMGLLGFYTGGGLLLYGWRGGRFESDAKFQPVSRETAFMLNNLFLATLAATVLIGTLYPLLISALRIGQISVGPPYFYATVVPLAVPLFILMGIGPSLNWAQVDRRAALAQIRMATIITVAIMGLIWAIVVHVSAGVMLGLGLGVWLMVTAAAALARRRFRPLSAWGMSVAHFGMGLALTGMIGTVLWAEENSQVLKPGQHMSAGRYTVTLDKVEAGFGPNYSTIKATLNAQDDQGDNFILQPERRHYPVTATRISATAIRGTWRDDLYTVLGQTDLDKTGGGWVVRATTHPLVPMLWTGYALVAIGGIVSLINAMKRRGTA